MDLNRQKNLLKDGYDFRANDISECADCVGWRCIMLSNERPALEQITPEAVWMGRVLLTKEER